MKVLHVTAVLLLCIDLTYGFLFNTGSLDLAQSQSKGKCVDVADICKEMKELGNCNNTDFKAFAKSDCPKSCGHCEVEKEEETFSAVADTCDDVSPLCADLKRTQGCIGTYFKKYMDRECKRTCGKCKKGVVESEETFSVDKVKKEECKNVKNLSPLKVCEELKKSHGCDNPLFEEHMLKECRKTCGFCKEDGEDDDDDVFSLGGKKPTKAKKAKKVKKVKKVKTPKKSKKAKKVKKVKTPKKSKKVRRGRTKWFNKGRCNYPISKETCIKYAKRKRIKRKSIKHINNPKMPHGCLITTRRSKGKSVVKTVKFNRASSSASCGRRGAKCVCYAG